MNGGLIDRRCPLSFEFDGRSYNGFAGDTLASALLASGIRLVGRSFKYHRPRGVLTAGPEEPNALVELGRGARREPNTRATTAELFNGLVAKSQNRWPSLAFDALAINRALAPIFVAGFYYKTFMWPASFWERIYEPLIRRAAGLGHAADAPDPDRYDCSHAFCDVLVVGAGPAGLSAALAAATAGARVILCENDFELGGRLLSERDEIDGESGVAWARRTERKLHELHGVRILRRTLVFGAYDSGVIGAVERLTDHLAHPSAGWPRQRFWKIVPSQTILCTGALERQLVFGGNDLPGVMSAAAVRTYINRFAVAPGSRAAVFTACDDGWRTAALLASSGVPVAAVIDPRLEVPSTLRAALSDSRTEVVLGGSVVDALGGRSLKRIEVSHNGCRRSFSVDLLAMSGGWSPQIALSTHLGGKPIWNEALQTFLAGQSPQGMAVTGAAAGVYGLRDCLATGLHAGTDAAAALGFSASMRRIFVATNEPSGSTALWRVQGNRTKAFVDQQHDVTTDDIELAAREGFTSVEHLKRYTTLGMATDQGKTSSLNGHAILAEVTGRTVPEVGSILSRPPYYPVAIGVLAGRHRDRHFRPTRRTAAHEWTERLGGRFVEAGLWVRAQCFDSSGRMDLKSCVSHEVTAVRSSVGICDISTLGKIDVQGSDAGAYLDRIYINSISDLRVGKTRYGLMLREDGIALDDGTISRLAPERFLVSTTTAHAALVMEHLEYARQVLWPELDVQLTSVTEQWSQYAIAGPRSRDLLTQLLGDAISLQSSNLPHMGCVEFELRGVPCRLFRMSFSGELAYELAVPARYGAAAFEALLEAGKPMGVIPYGTEALGVMRIEKGHIAGPEINGQTTAHDLGMARLMSNKKDFIGRVLAARPGLTDPTRPKLVGLRPMNPQSRIRAGAHLIREGAASTAAEDQGYVTSATFSPTLSSWIALGFLERAPARHGERIRACSPVHGEEVLVEPCSPIFFDSQGARLHG